MFVGMILKTTLFDYSLTSSKSCIYTFTPLNLESTVTDDDPWASIAAPAPTTKAKQINRTTSLAEDGVLNLLLQS